LDTVGYVGCSDALSLLSTCRASKLYQSANELVEGVALTAHDPEDQRKLHTYSASLLEKCHACKQRAAELFHYNS
jgi:hypothetical protein